MMHYHYPDYYDDPSLLNPSPFPHSLISGLTGAFIGILLLIVIAVLIYGFLSYLFTSLSLYTMAKKRNIKYPGLAFVPVANHYIIGVLIGDHVQIATLSIPYASILLAPASLLTTILVFHLTYDTTAIPIFIVTVLAVLLLSIYEYAAQYRLFKLYNPKNAVLYLVLTIILLGIPLPFLLFSLRNKKPVANDFSSLHHYLASPCALLSAILGFISIIFSLLGLGSNFWCVVSAIVFSILALSEKPRSKTFFPVIGIILSIVSILIFVVHLSAASADLITFLDYLSNPLSQAGSYYL